MTRGDDKSDKTPRFPRIAASLAPLFAVGGVLLFGRELRLGRLFGDPAQATLSITTLAVALGTASLLALLVRARRAQGPVPWVLLALVSMIPAACGALLPGGDDGLYATGLWCSAWLNAALGWVCVVEVFSSRVSSEERASLVVTTALSLAATALCALGSFVLVALAVVGWALPAAHLGRPGDAKAEGSLLCAPLFCSAGLWLGYCAMIRAGATSSTPFVLAACTCLLLDFVLGLWVVRPRALRAALPLFVVLGAWAVFEGARAESPQGGASVEVETLPAADDSQGLRVPYAPRNP